MPRLVLAMPPAQENSAELPPPLSTFSDCLRESDTDSVVVLRALHPSKLEKSSRTTDWPFSLTARSSSIRTQPGSSWRRSFRSLTTTDRSLRGGTGMTHRLLEENLPPPEIRGHVRPLRVDERAEREREVPVVGVPHTEHHLDRVVGPVGPHPGLHAVGIERQGDPCRRRGMDNRFQHLHRVAPPQSPVAATPLH